MFIANIITKSKLEIIDSAYKIVSYDNIISIFDDGFIENIKNNYGLNQLLEKENLLEYLYGDWMDFCGDVSYDNLVDCVEGSIKKISERTLI